MIGRDTNGRFADGHILSRGKHPGDPLTRAFRNAITFEEMVALARAIYGTALNPKASCTERTANRKMILEFGISKPPQEIKDVTENTVDWEALQAEIYGLNN